MDLVIQGDHYKGLTDALKDSLWSVAVYSSPYRTGNLRASIKRISLSKNKVMFAYSEQQAYYTDFLERGIGRNKKHIGFIENLTVGTMLSEIEVNAVLGINTFVGIPVLKLRTDIARNYERKILKSNNMNPDSRVNAFSRAKMSMIMYAKNKKGKNKTEFDLARYGNKVETINVR